MKLLCSQEELVRSLQIVTRVIPARSTMPILSGLLLETRDDQLFCFGSDLEVGIEIKIPEVTIITPGRIVVSGRTFYDAIRHLPPGRIEMGIDDGEKTFNIKTANSFFSLNIFPAEEYPALPEGIKTINLLREDKNRDRDALFLFSLQAAVFREAVKQSVYATAPQDSRPFLSSILWEFDEGNLRMVATDINRLVIKDLSIKCSSKNSFLVPVKALKEITTILENDDEQIDFLLVNKQLYAVSRGVVFYTRLINAQFPRYEQVIPKEFDGQVAFERSTFLSALTRSSLIDRAVKLSFSEDNINIFATEPDLGQFSEKLSGSYDGEPLEIGFNSQYIIDFLKVVGDEGQIVFNLSKGMKASVLKVKNNENYTYVIMPLRLNY